MTEEIKEPKKQTATEIDTELKALEVESKRLEIAEKKANLQDIVERLGERELRRETRRELSRTNGQTLRQLEANDRGAQARCNHKKGGNGAAGVVGGQGDDSQYAVAKHTMMNGDVWVRCLRCGKTYKPPFRSMYKTEEAYLAAFVEYKTAVDFTTRNVPSGSIRFAYSDGGKLSRELLANTTLR